MKKRHRQYKKKWGGLKKIAIIPSAAILLTIGWVGQVGHAQNIDSSSHNQKSQVIPISKKHGHRPWNKGNWHKYVLAPGSRYVKPVAVYKVLPRNGKVKNAKGLVHPNGQPTVLSLKQGDQTDSPLLILDIGKEVGGQVQIEVTSESASKPQLHVSFSESTKYMALKPGQNNGETKYAPGSDTANIWNGYPGFPYQYDSDSHIFKINPDKVPGTFTDVGLRGGFRYVTLYLSSPGSISIKNIRVKFEAAPHQKNLQDYKGYFLSSDQLLNKIWYAGAYTVQMNTWAPDTLKSWPYQKGEPDQANTTMPYANPNEGVILDGAKRDRDIWEGDLAIQGPVSYLSTNDISAWSNSLTALAHQQVKSGFVPAEGLVGQHNYGEEFHYGTYVSWYVNNMYQHYLYTGNKQYLEKWYQSLKNAMKWLNQQRDDTGLLDFQKSGACGTDAYTACGHLTYINALFYNNLQQMADLSQAMQDSKTSKQDRQEAASLKNIIYQRLWDPQVGAYRMSLEDPNTYPQDANAMAIDAGIANTQQANQALAYLKQHTWAKYGSLLAAPGSALPAQYLPIPSHMEVKARFETGKAASAVDLIDRYWGYMLKAPYGPQSTFWEKLNQQGLPQIAQFTSLAHGWASGPTISLTQELLGVKPTAPGYSTWEVVPHPADLKWAEGGVPTPEGTLKVRWQRNGKSGSLQEWLHAPNKTSGTIGIPYTGSEVVRINEQEIWNGHKALPSPLVSDVIKRNGYLFLKGVKGGNYHITKQHHEK